MATETKRIWMRVAEDGSGDTLVLTAISKGVVRLLKIDRDMVEVEITSKDWSKHAD